MTTQTEADQLKEAYRRARNARDVARNYERFRRGAIVLFRIEREPVYSPVSEGLERPPVGQFQLRYGPPQTPDGKSNLYCVYGRLDGSTKDDDWVPVDGPWPVGDGPFDTRRERR